MIPNIIDRAPWKILENETPRAFAAFNVYKKLGPTRSLAKTVPSFYGEEFKGSAAKVRQLAKWSSPGKYSWVERATLWDEEQDGLDTIARKEAVKEMGKRHASQALLLQQKSLSKIQEIDPADLTPKDALEYLKVATDLERKSRGAPDQIIDHSVAVKDGNVVVYLPENNRNKPIAEGGQSGTKDTGTPD